MRKIAFCAGMLTLSAGFLFAQSQPAVHETVLYAFHGGIDGANPSSGLVADASGNLYGIVPNKLYELSPPSVPGGSWTETTIYVFQGGADGSGPDGNLTLDAMGNLYGTTAGGGTSENCTSGCGTVFELSPPSAPGSPWTKTTLYNFIGGTTDGAFPNGSLIFDSTGTLYGTTEQGGNSNSQCPASYHGCGTVFQLSPSFSGAPWSESILHLFRGVTDGDTPFAGLTLGPDNDLYGATVYGGQDSTCIENGGCGTIFRLKRPSVQGSPWTEAILLHFSDSGPNGKYPIGTLALRNNKVYENAYSYDPQGPIVFELSVVNNTATETVLVNFDDQCASFDSGVVFDRFGNLYGDTSSAGCEGENDGGVFELKPPAMSGGSWTAIGAAGLTGGIDGGDPSGGVIIVGNAIYGVAMYGGDLNCGSDGQGCGVVYSYGP